MRTVYLPVYTLRPFERGIQETLGKYSGFVMPGLGFQMPFASVVRIRDVREHTMDIQPQSVITKDNVEITVDGIMWVRPAAEEEAIKPKVTIPFANAWPDAPRMENAVILAPNSDSRKTAGPSDRPARK